jgi:hypothetical protein
MTRASEIAIQILVVAIFGSSMFFLALAISREAAAMPTMHSFEAMPIPSPRENLDAGIVRLPSEARFDPPGGFVLTSHFDEVMPPCDDGDDDDAL